MQREELIEKHKYLSRQTIKQQDFLKSVNRIKEANKIASRIGWLYSFREIYIKNLTDSQGRSLSFASCNNSAQLSRQDSIQQKEEIQVIVKNERPGGKMLMWSENELADKLVMMRDALSLYEQIVSAPAEDPEAKEEIRKMMAEIFEEHYERKIQVNPEII